MRMWCLRSCGVAFAGSALLAGVTGAQVAVHSTVGAEPLAASMASSLTVAVTSGAIQRIASVTDNAANSFPSPVTITVAWDLHPSTGAVQVLAYFANPAAAMSSGPAAIPSSWVLGRVMTTGTPGAPSAYTPFTQNPAGGVGAAGGSLSLMTLPIVGNNRTGTRDIELALQLNLTGRVLTPGAYTGTLNIRAVTQ